MTEIEDRHPGPATGGDSMSYADTHEHYGYATTSDLEDLRRQIDAVRYDADHATDHRGGDLDGRISALQIRIDGLEEAFVALEGEVRELAARLPEGDQP
jgi:predicted  nucleic acid-binding Zn-ribbon protein